LENIEMALFSGNGSVKRGGGKEFTISRSNRKQCFAVPIREKSGFRFVFIKGAHGPCLTFKVK
jgi:hypothetical protein